MSFIWNLPYQWFTNFLSYFNLSSKKSAKILFIGLDNAGKTTLLKMIKDDRLQSPQPTHFPSSEELKLGNLTVTAFDLGGHEQARRIWKNYFCMADAIIFLIDAADFKRVDEARAELLDLITDEEISNIPILILGNKIDKKFAMDEKILKEKLGIGRICTGKTGKPAEGIRPLEVFMCSIFCRWGYGDGFKWLSSYLN
uniref:small monomeric GTPase n=1 Tax=Panagrolaimus davidi TaxID=227884 RepID=A0A914QMF0_9BILA